MCVCVCVCNDDNNNNALPRRSCLVHRQGRTPGQRETFLNLLFTLMKRPDEEQRGAMLAGLGVLARILGPPRLEVELLPHILPRTPPPRSEIPSYSLSYCSN